MVKGVILSTLVLAGIQPESGESQRYVPAIGWEDDDWAPNFYERWYGGQLSAMDEPPIATAAAPPGLRRRIRLLIVPNYAPAESYRLDEHDDGTVVLRRIRLDGSGGYAPGKIAEQETRIVDRKTARRLAAAIERAELSARPRDLPPRGVRANTDGTQTISICLHATHYVFEQVGKGGAQFLARDACELEKPLQRLIRAFIRLHPKPGG